MIDKGWGFRVRNGKAVGVKYYEKWVEAVPESGEIGAFGRTDNQ